jgi:hypothetical protein
MNMDLLIVVNRDLQGAFLPQDYWKDNWMFNWMHSVRNYISPPNRAVAKSTWQVFISEQLH